MAQSLGLVRATPWTDCAQKTWNTLSCSPLMFFPKKNLADAECARQATAQGNAIRAVKVHTSCQNLPEPLIETTTQAQQLWQGTTLPGTRVVPLLGCLQRVSLLPALAPCACVPCTCLHVLSLCLLAYACTLSCIWSTRSITVSLPTP